MKAITIFWLAMMMLTTGAAAGIVGSGSTSEDSIAISVHLTDSLGNPSGTHADSFSVCIIGPSGDSLAAFAGTAAASGLHVDSLQTTMLGWTYVFAEAVNKIDGVGRSGAYELTFCAKDNGPKYVNCARTAFQIAGSNLSPQLGKITTILDSLLAVLDTLQNQDDWVSSFDPIGDSAARHAVADAVWDEDTAGHNQTGSFAVMVKDTSAYQGSAAGLDSAVVQRIGNRRLDSTQNAYVGGIAGGAVDAVWDEPQAGHGAAGTFGAYLDAAISGISSPAGDGSYPVSLAARDSVGGQMVPGVKVSLYNAGMTALMAIGATGSDGVVRFNVDSGAYVVSPFAPGYVFSAYDTILVAGATVDTVIGVRFNPGNPASPNLCRMYGFFYGLDGQPVEGVTVTAALTGGAVRHDSLIISPFERVAVSDSAGYFYIDLIPSNDFDPSGTAYMITASYPAGSVLKKRVEIPQSSGWLLSW